MRLMHDIYEMNKRENRRKPLDLLLFFFLYLIVMTVVYRNILSNDSLIVSGDGIGYYISKHFLKESLALGQLPLWNPYVSIGTPFIADAQTTFFSPMNLIYAMIDSTLGYNLFYIINLTFGGFFMYLYLDILYNNKFVAILAGFIFSFSAMLGGRRIEHPTIVSTIIFYPLILYFLERFKEVKSDKYLVFSSIAMAVQFMSGFTQIVLYFDLVLFLYFLIICVELKLPTKQIFLKSIKWIILYLLICFVQIIPMIQLMIQSGRGKVPYEFFSVLSYDLRILLFMFFPYAFTDIYVPFGEYASTGIDIELYLGIICITYAIYAMVHRFNDKRVKFYIVIMIGVFLFGMAPNIPYLGRIIYLIPIVGSFRGCARIINILLFFTIVLFVDTLNSLKEKGEVKALLNFSIFFTALLTIFSIGMVLVSSDVFLHTKLQINNINWTFNSYGPILLMSFINIGILFVIYRNFEQKFVNRILIILLVIIGIADVGRYSIINEPSTILDSSSNKNMEHIRNLADNKNKGIYRSIALIDEEDCFVDGRLDLFRGNRSMLTKDLIFNNSLTFIDQKLTNYGIGEILFYPNTSKIMQSRNDLGSMLSIRYFVVPEKVDLDTSIPMDEAKKTVFSKEEIYINHNDGNLSVINNHIIIEPNSYYKITFVMNTDSIPKMFYVDFYNDNYDNSQQDGYFGSVGNGEMTTIIRTGNNVPREGVNFRIISQSDYGIDVSNLKVEKMKTEIAYKLIRDENNIKVYENENAKSILYVPRFVKSIDAFSNLYEGSNIFKLNECNYILNYDKELDLTGGDTRISDINLQNNYVTATVTSDIDTFINHSQLFYPGWKAYVDGKEVPVYDVNNLIQGIEVPSGKHDIKFVFDPIDIKIGAVFSIMGIIMSCHFIIMSNKKDKFKISRHV